MSKKVLLTTLLLGALISGVWLHGVSQESVFHFGTFSQHMQVLEAEMIKEDTVSTEIAFVGDVMLARNVEYVQNKYGVDYIFDALPTLSSTTVLVGNFESAIAKVHEPTPNMGFSFSTPSSTISSLKDYGFSYLSLANNHSYDKGKDAFKYTQDILRTNGLVAFGDQVISSSTVVYTQIQGKTVALIGVYAVAGMPDMPKLTNEIGSASLNSDFQVAYVHWGTEYELTHSGFQEQLAEKLIDGGIDAVIGHHPHVVQDIQYYKEVPIFYSLGNFVFDQYFNKEVQDGLWIELSFDADVPVYRLRPITAAGSYSQPRFMSAYNRDGFFEALAERSDPAIAQQITSGLLTVP